MEVLISRSRIILGVLFFAFQFNASSVQARIVNRKVKEAPKTCAIMSEDAYLSRKLNLVYGTLKNSVIINDTSLSVVDDLGKKVCQWPVEKFGQYAVPEKFKFYIDEYKNIFVPYVKIDEGYLIFKIDLNTCDVVDQSTQAELSLPKCEPPKKSKKSKKRKVASIKSKK